MNIAIMGYKGGVGKTTISKLIGDLLVSEYKEKSIILNMDFYQKKNIKIYSIEAKNIDKNESLNLEEYKDYENVIIDCGGFSDSRVLKEIDKIDKIILPTKKGNLSFLELLTVIQDINTPKHILIIINDFVKNTEKEKNEQIELLKQMLKQISVKHKYDLMYFKHYETVTNLEKMNEETKKGFSIGDFIKKAKWMVSFQIVKNEMIEIIKNVKEERN